MICKRFCPRKFYRPPPNLVVSALLLTVSALLLKVKTCGGLCSGLLEGLCKRVALIREPSGDLMQVHCETTR